MSNSAAEVDVVDVQYGIVIRFLAESGGCRSLSVINNQVGIHSH